MKQSIWCQYHNFWHDIEDTRERAAMLDHLHSVDMWFTSDDGEVIECVVCGDQWGAV